MLSAVIITKNAAHCLPDCLASLSFADEILVVDSGSCDATVALAQAAGARVLHQDWLGFGPQKQFAVQNARHDWVLCLDADERISPALATSIKTELQAPRGRVYRMARCNRFLGRWLRFGEGYPDYNIRLFHRDAAFWSEHLVHEHVVANEAVLTLAGDLLHESAETLASYLNKQNQYTSLQAEALFAAGKRARISQLVFSPLLRFLKMYLLRQGFRDGVPGLIHIAIGCGNSFFKYAKLLERQGQRHE